MNKSYKSVLNESTGTWVAAAETAKGRGKASKSRKVVLAAMLAAGMAGTINAKAGAVDGGTATGTNGAIAVGNSSVASGSGSIAMGDAGSTGTAVAVASGTDAMALGNGSTASALDATAIGVSAMAKGSLASAFGASSYASGANSVAFGASSYASGSNSVAVGPTATAVAANDVAIGYNAATRPGASNSTGAIAIGFGATANGAYANSSGANMAIGAGSVAGQSDASTSQATALGTNAQATNWSTTAVGTAANASGIYSSVIGAYAVATGTLASAIGNRATASGSNASALGSYANASADNSTALGDYSTTTANLAAAGYNAGSGTLSGTASAANGEVSVGSAGKERRVTNVAAGSAATDAVNVSQLQSEDGKVNQSGTTAATALGGGAAYSSTTGAISAPSYALTNANSIGGTTGAATDVGTGFGKVDTALGTLNTNVTNLTNNINNGLSGLVQQDATTHAITVAAATAGTTVDFTGTAGTRQLKGISAGTATTDAVNVGQLAAAGMTVDTNGHATNSFVAYDSTAKDKVTLGGGTAGTTITNVKAGALSAVSTDAVNGSQLFTLASSTADALGGGSTVNSDGTITKPTYNIGGDTYNTVGDALTNLDDRVTDNTNSIDNINNVMNNITEGGGIRYFHTNSTLPDSVASGLNAVAIGGNAQATANNAVALGANSVADRENSVSVGSAGNERQITNVAAGTADTDAVNVSQLKQAGIINPTGIVNTAVTYDNNTDGSTNYNSITMGGGVAGGTVIHNVANGSTTTDAVNFGQLNDALSQVNNSISNSTNPFVSVNGDRNTQAASATGTQAAAMGASAVATGNNSTALGSNSQATADNSVALGQGSVADRANSVSVGTVGGERQVTNVAAGTQGTDAVNLNQLNSVTSAGTSAANGYTDQRFNQANQSIQTLDKSTRQGIASASALQIVAPYLPGRTTLNAGIATYRGQSALGIGASRWNDKGTINYNLGVSTSGSDSTIVRAGVAIVLGD